MGLCLLIHAGATVGDGEHYILARHDRESPTAHRFGKIDVVRGEHQLAALRHRIARIDCKIHQHLFDLTAVGAHLSQGGITFGFQLHVFAQEPLQEFLHIADNFAKIHSFKCEDLTAAEGQQLPRQCCRSIGGFGYLLKVSLIRSRISRFIAQQLCVSLDHRKQIVEIVRHTTSEAPDRFHLLCLP